MNLLNNKAKLVYAIIAMFVLVKVFIALQAHPAGWDESVYTGMGKHIYSSGTNGLWEDIRPVGLPVLLGAIWKLGLPFGFFAELLMTAFAAGSLLLVYRIATKLFNNTTGLLSVLLFVSSGIFFRQSSLFLTEIPSTFFALAMIYYLLQRKLAAASTFAAIAAIFKFPHVMLSAILLLFFIVEFRKTADLKKTIKSAFKMLPYAAIMLIFLFRNYLSYNNGLLGAVEPFLLAASHQSNPLENVLGLNGFLFYFIVLLKENIFFSLLPLGIWFSFKERKNVYLGGYLLLYFSYLTVIANKQERFVLIFLPIAAIFAAYGVYRLLLWDKGTTKIGLVMTVLLVGAGIFTSYGIITQDISYIKERQNAELPDYSQIGKTALSSNPRIAYYKDNKIIPFYFSTADKAEGIKKAVERFEENKNNSIILFDIKDFHCTEEDTYCEEQLSALRKNQS
jgi:4-amino-4-deoxy-L-arabinose transferase-like glycosyltransferase